MLVLACTLATLLSSPPVYPQSQGLQEALAPAETPQKTKKSKSPIRVAYRKPKLFIEACTPLIDEISKQIKALNRFDVVDQITGDGSHLRVKCRGGKAVAELLFYPKQFNTDGEVPGIVAAEVTFKGRSIRRQAKAVSKRLVTEVLKKAPWQGEVIDLTEIPYVDPKISDGSAVENPQDLDLGDPATPNKTKKLYRVNLSIGNASAILEKPCQPLVFGTLAVDLPASNVLFAPLAEGVATRVDKYRSVAEVRFIGKQPRQEYPLFVTVPSVEKISDTMVPLVKECEKLLQTDKSIIPTWLDEKFGADVYGVLEGVGIYISWLKTDDDRTLNRIKTMTFENELQLGQFLSLDLSGKIGFVGEDQTWEPRVVEKQNKAEMFTTMVTVGPSFPFGSVNVHLGLGATFDNFNNPYPRVLTDEEMEQFTEIDSTTQEETYLPIPEDYQISYRKNVKVRPTLMLKFDYEMERSRITVRNAVSNGFNGFHYDNELQGFYSLSRTWSLGLGAFNYRIGKDSRLAPGIRITGVGVLLEVKL